MCFQLRHSVRRERTRGGERGRDEGRDGSSGRQSGSGWKIGREQGVEKGKGRAAGAPAGRGKCESCLGADTGAQSVFIGPRDFNPQYWPKPLAEGWSPSPHNY